MLRIDNNQLIEKNPIVLERVVSNARSGVASAATVFGILLLVGLICSEILSLSSSSIVGSSVRENVRLTRTSFIHKNRDKLSAKLFPGLSASESSTPSAKSYISFISDIVQKTSRRLTKSEALSLAEVIVNESQVSGFDPLFVAAVVKAESTFNQQATSNRGARGLMQLLPSTGEYISSKGRIGWEGEHRLHEPAYNIRLGITYLKYLSGWFEGNREKVLVAYNWGPNNLKSAIRSGASAPASSQDYARKILNTHAKWKSEFEVQVVRSEAPSTSLLG